MQARRSLIGRDGAVPLGFLPVASDYNMSTRKRAVINSIIYLYGEALSDVCSGMKA